MVKKKTKRPTLTVRDMQGKILRRYTPDTCLKLEFKDKEQFDEMSRAFGVIQDKLNIVTEAWTTYDNTRAYRNKKGKIEQCVECYTVVVHLPKGIIITTDKFSKKLFDAYNEQRRETGELWEGKDK